MWKSLKRRPVLLALLVAFGLLTVALLCFPRGNRVTRANCERIKLGMTEPEVRAILGKPWDDSLLDPEEPRVSARTKVLWTKSKRENGQFDNGIFWSGNNLFLIVAWDPDGTAAVAQLFYEPDPPSTSLPTRVWRRLRARYGW